MSRYTTPVSHEVVKALNITPEEDAQYNLAYGYDEPMSEYFISLYKQVDRLSEEDYEEEEEYWDAVDKQEEESHTFSISNYYTMKRHPKDQKMKYKTHELLAHLTNAKSAGANIPSSHLELMQMDLPF